MYVELVRITKVKKENPVVSTPRYNIRILGTSILSPDNATQQELAQTTTPN